MSEEIKGITVHFDGEELFLQTAIIGGVTGDALECPMGMYAGKLLPEDVGLSLLHSLRAVIKITRDHWRMDMDKAEDFIIFTLAEAIRCEKRENPRDNFPLNVHHDILARLRKENLDYLMKKAKDSK